eukprot:CAMPEP_0118964398 /NCGR_PEP_ID=MMETSP1173-20130426/2105_1 /TAXON_ID=1034831 /ORGANISM="Rhizochromulina marina cf, Strain CCMP1243" /LENGTH=136 /DNA_ID=CAMNT_0006912851 /DNA_START=96 /DNA_END=506 /DNA_ORIENTATION=-
MTWAPYHSVKAVHSAGGEDDKQWLMFWIVMSLVNTLETFGIQYVIEAVSIQGNSFYYELKAAFVVYLMFFKGATQIFDTFVSPFVSKYEKHIDEAIAKAQQLGAVELEEAMKDPKAFAAKHGQAVLDAVNNAKKSN